MKSHAQRLAVMHAVWLVAYDDATADVLVDRAALLLRIPKDTLLDGLDADWIDRVFCSRPFDWKPEDSLAVMGEVQRAEIAAEPIFRVGIDQQMGTRRLNTAVMAQKSDAAAAVDLIKSLGLVPVVTELEPGTRLFNAEFECGTRYSLVPASYLMGFANFTPAQRDRLQAVLDGKSESASAKNGRFSIKLTSGVVPSSTGGSVRLFAGGQYVATLREPNLAEDLRKYGDFLAPATVMAAKNEVRDEARRRLVDDPAVIAEYSKMPEADRLEALTGQLAGEMLFSRMKKAGLVEPMPPV